MIHYISVTAFGYVSQEPMIQQTSFGKKYARMIVGVKSPTKSEKSRFTWLECTIWEETLLVKLQKNQVHRGDEIMIMGQFYTESYGGNTYQKVYVRDFTSAKNTNVDINQTPEILSDGTQNVDTITEDTNVGNANVNEEDFGKNF